MAVVEIRHGIPDDAESNYDAIPRGYGRDEFDRWRPPLFKSSGASFPHCDARVLHAPGECAVCDLHVDDQRQRISAGIAFTGHAPKIGEEPCPADLARPPGSSGWHGRWGGNVPAADQGESSDGA